MIKKTNNQPLGTIKAGESSTSITFTENESIYVNFGNTENCNIFRYHIDKQYTLQWEKLVSQIDISIVPIGMSPVSDLFLGIMNTGSDESHLILKKFRNKTANENYFMDVIVQKFAQKWAEIYNSFQISESEPILFLDCFVIQLIDRKDSPFFVAEVKKLICMQIFFSSDSPYIDKKQNLIALCERHLYNF